MHIEYSNIYDMIRDIYHVKSVLNIKRVKLKRKDIVNLHPLRDIDDNIITCSIGRINEKLVFPTRNEDLYELMTFEQERVAPSIFRDEELFDPRLDYQNYKFTKYSYDDVPLSDSIVYQGIPKNYSIDTDLEQQVISKLNYINLYEDIVPSSFSSNLSHNAESVELFSKAAHNFMFNGVSVNKIIKSIEKSFLKQRDGKHIADVDLFMFLVKNPKERGLVVLKDIVGNEYLNKSAITYWSVFKRMFGDVGTAKKVLQQCSLVDKLGQNTVDARLCEIASLLARTEQTSKKATKNNVVIYQEKAIWTDQMSQILEKVKNGNKINEIYYKTIKHLIHEKKKSFEFVFENIDSIVKNSIRIENSNKIMQERRKNSYGAVAHSKIKSFLTNQLKEYTSPKGVTHDIDLILTTLEYMLSKDIPIEDIACILNKIVKLTDKAFYGSPEEIKQVIELCRGKDLKGNVCINRRMFNEFYEMAKDNPDKFACLEYLKTLKSS